MVSDHVLSQMKLPHHLILTHLVINIRDADDGGLVWSGRRGGEDDLLTRRGVPLSVKELQH